MNDQRAREKFLTCKRERKRLKRLRHRAQPVKDVGPGGWNLGNVLDFINPFTVSK